MRILKKDLKSGVVKVLIQSTNDLWVLSSIIEEKDYVEGSTERKIVIGDSKEGKSKTQRKKVFLGITVEKTEFTEDSLRLLGVITKAPDFIAKGDHHSFTLVENNDILIKKTSWLNYQLAKIQEATLKEESLLVTLFNREQAIFYEVNNQGVKKLNCLKGNVSKKDNQESKITNFYKEILQELELRYQRKKYAGIIAGSPAFWKEYLVNELKKSNYQEEFKKKFVFTTISDVEKTAIRELLGRSEVASLIKKTKATKELSIVEDCLKELSHDKLGYGSREVKELLNEGNISKLIITENKIMKDREKGLFRATEKILRSAEVLGAEVIVLETEMKQIDGLTGIVAIKRWNH